MIVEPSISSIETPSSDSQDTLKVIGPAETLLASGCGSKNAKYICTATGVIPLFSVHYAGPRRGRQASVIPQEDIDNDPEAFAWYEGPQGVGLAVPFQFKKYPNRPVNETPMGYLHYIVNKCNWYTKDIHWAFFDAIGTYFEGLMEYAKDHYAEFIVPGFSRKHRGKRLQQCRDKPWMEWTTTRPDLTQKYIVYFTAVRYLLDNPRHYTANRDIGELLSVTRYEDDLDLVEEDDEYEMNSFINDDDAEEEQEQEQEQESSETTDDSEASRRTEVETTQPSDVEGSQSGISGGIDSELSMWTPPRMIPVHGMASLGSTYRLENRHNSCSPGPVPMPPSPIPRKRRKGPGSSEVNSVSKGMLHINTRYPTSLEHPIASPRKRKFSSVDSSYHSEDADDAEEDKPAPSRRRKRGPRKGKQKPPTSEMKDFVSGSEESNGNEDYVSSATENDNLSDLADGAQPHQLRSGREYGPNKSRLKKETASKESPRPTSRDRESPGVIRSAISSANDSGSDEPNRLNILGSTSERTSSPDTQGISRRCPPELGPTHAYMPNSDQAASSSKRRRTAYRVVSSSEDESRSPSPELYQPTESRSASPERPVRRFRRLRRWSERTA
ncbi:hypothetical protein IW261DRAFT_1651868 [Armillaria novae-zelandiae]|uniref:Uncharacterized protein n=1 Tax=Armillaria novae-zelandiae TaxID=153914 RepID=A0AA39NYB2_9AGAR|nr:hypothetical protein IW261DRAFT_1651868 [Armillaria novae-zelandiae]